MKYFYSFLFLCLSLFTSAQLNMTLKSNVTYAGNGNDIWAYVAPDGSEYAVVGTTIGTRIYSLEDLENPIERAFIEGSNSIWRDMKQWGEYVYVTADSGNDGLLIIDMTGAPDVIDYKYLYPEVLRSGNPLFLERCHNIFIDENGIIYLAGCQGGNTEFFDPNTDPLNPEYIGSIPPPYSHDVYAKGDTVYTSEIYQGVLAMYDASDKSNPIFLGSVETSGKFTHNGWADPTNTYAFSTDEIGEGFLDAYDVSDPSNMIFLDKFMPPGTAGTGTIPHNTHYIDGFLVTSWYTSGVVVTDANKPDNLIQVAVYDTYDGPNGGFSGCWGATPYLPSGALLANDINSGLYIFDIDYIRACYLEGDITDISTGASISNVEINLISSDEKDLTHSKANGNYKTGQATAGTFMVEYSHALYETVTHEVTLTHGVVTIQDVQLGAQPTFTVNFLTVEDQNGNPISNSQIFLQSDQIDYHLKTDESGNASGTIIEGNYTIYCGAWGFHNIEIPVQNIAENKDLTIELPTGYMDDFIVDLGWNVIDFAQNGNFTGTWERDIPAGTYSGNGSVVNPDVDVIGDIGNMAYVTENVIGASSFSNDVDDGTTILTSPSMDLSNYTNPEVKFKLWFVNYNGSVDPNDNIVVSISNGLTTEDLLDYNISEEGWTDAFSFTISDFIDLTENMNLIVTTSDFEGTGNIVEAGFDQFIVIDSPVNAIEGEEFTKLKMFPSPASKMINLISNKKMTSVEITNNLGQTVLFTKESTRATQIDISSLVNGSYYVKVITEGNITNTYPLQIIR